MSIQRNYLPTVLAIAVLGSLYATDANAFEVYNNNDLKADLVGRLYAGHKFTEGDNAINDEGTDTFARIGLNFSGKINDYVIGIGQYEGQFAVDDEKESESKNNIRILFGGLQFTDYGTISFGRQKAVTQYLGDWTDTAFSNNFSAKALGRGANVYGTQRTNDLLKYQITISDFTFGVNYKFEDYGDEDKNDKQRADAKGVLAAYKIGDFQIGAAFTSSRAKAIDEDTTYTDVGFIYDNKKYYFATNYVHATDFLGKDIDHDAVETAIIYRFDSGLDIGAHYEWRDASGGKNNDVSFAILDTQYRFNKYFRIGADYRFNTLGGKDNDAEIFARVDF